MKRALAFAVVLGIAGAASASAHYDGAHASFTIPPGTKVTDGSDIAADWAFDVAVPSIANVRISLIGGDAQVNEAELTAKSTAWRDKRLRNRASWGVPHAGEHRIESAKLGALHAVKLVDDVSSTMSGRQLMLCAIVSSHLVCGVATGPPETLHDAAGVLEQMLTTLKLR